MYKLIDGKKIAQRITADVTRQIIDEGLEPQLAVILVGNDPASHLYVSLKDRACKKAGITLHKYFIEETTDEAKVIDTVRFLNSDDEIDAILIQLPMPEKFNQQRILDAMDYRKDVDGFHKKNIERLLSGKPQHILPGLSLAVLKLIEETGHERHSRKRALIVSKSDVFSKPLAKILADHEMSPKFVTPGDPRLAEEARTADILITAVGNPRFVTGDMVKQDAIVIDVGISRVDGHIVGDVDFETVAPKTSFITPVPGGVGPMTVAMLLYNTMLLARLRSARITKPVRNPRR